MLLKQVVDFAFSLFFKNLAFLPAPVTFHNTLLSTNSTLTIVPIHFLNWKTTISMSVYLMASDQSIND